LGLVSGATGQRWLIDATPALPQQLAQLASATPPRIDAGLDGVLLTHAHMGHYTGLIHLGQEAANLHQVPVWVMPRMRALLENSRPWEGLVRQGNIRLLDLEAERSVQLAPDLVVTPIRVPHRDEYSETVAFYVAGPTRKALWLPDIDAWDDWDQDLALVLDGVDIAWVDGTFFDDQELPGRDLRRIRHPRIRETMERLAGLPEAVRARVRFVHLNHSNPVLDPESEPFRSVYKAGFKVAQQGTVELL
jgi:pyrroloquinoline quinone biosynthesis protein B